MRVSRCRIEHVVAAEVKLVPVLRILDGHFQGTAARLDVLRSQLVVRVGSLAASRCARTRRAAALRDIAVEQVGVEPSAKMVPVLHVNNCALDGKVQPFGS